MFSTDLGRSIDAVYPKHLDCLSVSLRDLRTARVVERKSRQSRTSSHPQQIHMQTTLFDEDLRTTRFEPRIITVPDSEGGTGRAAPSWAADR